MRNVYLGLGSNLGDRELNLKNAVIAIAKHIGRIVCSSQVFETEPLGFNSNNKFLNMVVEVETDKDPVNLMRLILETEASLGRRRDSGKKYTSRIIDIDMLIYGNTVIRTGFLTVPHPRMHERKFVLVPLCEIAAGFIHPVFGKTFKMLLDECQDKSSIEKQNRLG